MLFSTSKNTLVTISFLIYMYTILHCKSETVVSAPLYLSKCHSNCLVHLHMLHLDKHCITSLFFLFLKKNINIAYVSYISELFDLRKKDF